MYEKGGKYLKSVINRQVTLLALLLDHPDAYSATLVNMHSVLWIESFWFQCFQEAV